MIHNVHTCLTNTLGYMDLISGKELQGLVLHVTLTVLVLMLFVQRVINPVEITTVSHLVSC